MAVFVQRLQAENQLSRTDKQRRQEQHQRALQEELAQQATAAKAAAEEVTHVPEPRPLPIKPKPKRKAEAAGSSGAVAGLAGLQQAKPATGKEQEEQPADAKPWRQNMRRKPTPLSSEQPAGAPGDIVQEPATGGPPPHSLAPATTSARMKDLDPVARAQLKARRGRGGGDDAVHFAWGPHAGFWLRHTA